MLPSLIIPRVSMSAASAAASARDWEAQVCRQVQPNLDDDGNELAFDPARLRELLGSTPEPAEAVGRRRWQMAHAAMDNIDDSDSPPVASAPLHLAALLGKDEALRLLVEMGADVNSYVEYTDAPLGERLFETPLHIAVRRQHRSTVEALLVCGADPEIIGLVKLDYRKRSGFKQILIGSALEFAGEHTDQDIVMMLQDKKVKLVQGRNLLTIAAKIIAEKPAKDAELIMALENQARIGEVQSLWSKEESEMKALIDAKDEDLSAEIRKKEEELRVLEKNKEESLAGMKDQYEGQKSAREEQVKSLRDTKEFRSAKRLKMLSKEVEDLKAFVTAVKDVLAAEILKDEGGGGGSSNGLGPAAKRMKMSVTENNGGGESGSGGSERMGEEDGAMIVGDI